MNFRIRIISFTLGLIFFWFILIFIKKNSFKPSYAFLWFIISLFLLSIPIAEPFYRWIAISLIGITDARHIIYIALIGFLLIYSFFLTIKISKMNDQIQVLICYTAFLERQIQDYKNEK